ncbi:amino acid ABC transporter permease [uncultured Ilyobacter sp.]|uniref:amino acid ABC transporter permease n=1 Tax=uncultured Ilyobacter sp. TaxID=544433 RepID=UPI003749E9F4
MEDTLKKCKKHCNNKNFEINLKNIFFRKNRDIEASKTVEIINILIIVAIIFAIFNYAFGRLEYNYMWKETIVDYRYKFIKGFSITIAISFFSLFCSLVIGTMMAIGQRTTFLPVYYFSKFYVEFIRGTPLIVQIYLFFYVVGTAFNITDRYIMGILIMASFSGAYVAEIIRSGIESIGASQLETAKALAFTPFQTYIYIILPQVIKRITPPLAGQFASLIKDSSLLSIIAVNEFTKNVQEVDSLTYAPVENYFILAVGYLLLTYPISHYSKYLERKFSYES